MSKKKKIICGLLLAAFLITGAVLLAGPMTRNSSHSNAAINAAEVADSSSDSKFVPDSKFVDDAQGVDERLWNTLLKLSQDYGPYNNEIIAAYQEKDRDKFMCILAKQVIVNLGRCRKQLDNTADDAAVGYRDEVLLYYALRFRALELSYAEPILKKLADKNDQSVAQDQESLVQFGEFITKEVAMLANTYRCAQLHGGYLLWTGKSEEDVRRDYAKLGLADKDIENCLTEARRRCEQLKQQQTSASGAAAKADAGSSDTNQYNTDYPRYYYSTDDRIWNTANYLSLCLQNEIWWLKTFSNKRDDELQKKLCSELAADIQMCRRKIEAYGAGSAPEVKKAAVSMCAVGEEIVRNYNDYVSGKIEYKALEKALQKGEAEFVKLNAGLYEARRIYLTNVTRDPNMVNHTMFNDGISPIAFHE